MTKRFRLIGFLLPICVLVGVGSLVYSVVTGDTIGSSVHYNTFGRVINAGIALALLGYGIYAFTTFRVLDKSVPRRERGD